MLAKRLFDIFFSLLALILTGWIILFFALLATIDTRKSGFFLQKRVGQYGKLFTIYKLRSMTFTLNGQKHISALGRFLRKSKLDEFPQFLNILLGQMSFVGPRPDVPGYYDKLQGSQREILKLKPGLTGPASLKYRNEEFILSSMQEPLKYNDEVLFPDKVLINLEYQKKRTLELDIKILFYTFFLR